MNATRRLVRALAGSSRIVESTTGISGAQLFVLRTLADNNTGLSVNELAELTLTHQSTVSGVVSKLVDQELVSRVPDADDARRMHITITARGKTLLRHAPPTIQSQLVDGLSRLTPMQQTRLANALEIWMAISGIEADAPMMFLEHDVVVDDNDD